MGENGSGDLVGAQHASKNHREGNSGNTYEDKECEGSKAVPSI